MTDGLKIYVTNDFHAVISCPSCGSAKRIPVEKFKGVKHSLKAQCKCGNVFKVTLDFRKKFRKVTPPLSGKFSKVPPGNDWMQMTVKDLSNEGIGIKASYYKHLQQEDKLRIRFNLNDASRTEVDTLVRVRHVSPEHIGCQFIDLSEFSRAIGFYLM